LDCRYVHFDTTSRHVWGEYQYAETQAFPFQVTYGYSKDKQLDLKPCVLSTLCVDRAVPIWGKPEDGNASAKTLNRTLLSEITQLLAHYGVQPGAYICIAAAALVTEDSLAALRDTLFITRLPTTNSECGRIIAEAVAHNHWEVVGVLAQTPPTKHRPVGAGSQPSPRAAASGTCGRGARAKKAFGFPTRLMRDIHVPEVMFVSFLGRDRHKKSSYFTEPLEHGEHYYGGKIPYADRHDPQQGGGRRSGRASRGDTVTSHDYPV
jgi:hypothetical protein